MKITKEERRVLARLGRTGGSNSRRNLPPERRTELARRAAAARWKKHALEASTEGTEARA